MPNNGYLHVDSQPEKGTSFHIYLPVHRAEKSAVEKQIHSTPAVGTETILVVEDEPALLRLCERNLQSLGYKTLIADCPLAALEIAKDYPEVIHLLLTDVIMPEMSGQDLYVKTKTLLPTLKCIFMSGYSADIISHNELLGHDLHCLQKPFSKAALAAMIREVLDDNAKLPE